MVHPDAIDHDARRQWVIGGGAGLRQLEPTAPPGERTSARAAEHLEELPRDLLALRLRVAPQEDARVARARDVDQDEGVRRRRGRLELPPIDLHLELAQRDPGLLVEE